jgi:hypothetical protein
MIIDAVSTISNVCNAAIARVYDWTRRQRQNTPHSHLGKPRRVTMPPAAQQSGPAREAFEDELFDLQHFLGSITRMIPDNLTPRGA